jgi:hypothetical protein
LGEGQAIRNANSFKNCSNEVPVWYKKIGPCAANAHRALCFRDVLTAAVYIARPSAIMNWIVSNKHILLLMLVTVLVRMPNLDRPLSKHHEYNAAVTLINAQSWGQAGGASKFAYTPLMNYQGYANKVWEEGPHVDSLHNHLYISIGPGAFVLPYLFFKVFHLPISPLGLQILNLVFSLWGIWLFYRLILQVTGHRGNAVNASAIYALLPSVLWYTGNGYVNTAIMLPLVILILMRWHKIDLQKGKVKPSQQVYLLLLLILLTWFDWFAFFLGCTMTLWALLRARKSKGYLVTAAVVAVGVAAGVFLVLFQYAGYFGWDHVLDYWKARFVDRSTDTSRFSFLQMLLMCIRNLVSGYLPVLLLLPIAFIKRISVTEMAISWPFWALLSVIPYNGLFFNWSAEHEFAWLAFGLMAVLYIGVYLLPTLSSTMKKWLVGLSILVSFGIYLVINRPGEKSWKGDLYAGQMHLGSWISQHVDASIPIFTNFPNDKITEYYSRRTFTAAPDVKTAQSICQRYGIQKATWLYIINNKVERQVLLIFPAK